MAKNKIKKLVDDLNQLYKSTPPGLITPDLEKSLIEVIKWLARLFVLGIKPKKRVEK
jgi:hypothetical protein